MTPMESLGWVGLGLIFIWVRLKIAGSHMQSNEISLDFILGLLTAVFGFGIELGVILL